MDPKREEEVYMGLTTASGIAYDQLASKSRGSYDAARFVEILNRAGHALIRAAPVYTIDSATGERRRLTEAELLTARVTRSASVLVLADGSTLRDLSILRSDLHTAISLLKAAGLQAFSAEPSAESC
jgi:hypothetical protein